MHAKETKKVQRETSESMSGVTTYVLKKPIKFGEEIIEKIVIQPPKAKHLRKMPLQPSPDDIMNLISVLSGTSSAELGELESVDYYELLNCMGKLLADGLEIGEKA